MALRRHRFAVPDHPGISLLIVLLAGLVMGSCGRKEEASFRTIRLADPAAIASAVRELFADPVRYEQMRRNARAAAQVFNWENEGAKLVNIYQGLSADRGEST